MGISLCAPVSATPLAQQNLQTVNAQAEIDQALVERIIRYVQVNYDIDYNCLCDMYQKGLMTIEKSQDGYLVRVGNLLQVSLDENI